MSEPGSSLDRLQPARTPENAQEEQKKPANLEEMLQRNKRLAKQGNFARLYEGTGIHEILSNEVDGDHILVTLKMEDGLTKDFYALNDDFLDPNSTDTALLSRVKEKDTIIDFYTPDELQAEREGGKLAA